MTEKTRIPMPNWYLHDFADRYDASIAHEFILFGDINGLLPNTNYPAIEEPGYVSLKEFFAKAFKNAKMVVFYNIASGLTFLTPEMEIKFRQTVGNLDASTVGNPFNTAMPAEIVRNQKRMPKDPTICLEALEIALARIKDMAVILQSAHHVVPNTVGMNMSPVDRVNIQRLINWSTDSKIKANRNIIILITDQISKISQEIRESGNGISSVRIDKPDIEQRKLFLEMLTKIPPEAQSIMEQLQLARLNADTAKIESLYQRLDTFNFMTYEISPDFSMSSMIHTTQGLNLQQIHEIFVFCRSRHVPVAIREVREKKNKILNDEFGDVLEVKILSITLDQIGGLEHIKNYFHEVTTNISEGRIEFVPMGITLMGPPGTGKSAICEALAATIGFNFVELKSPRGSFVGESEAKKEKQLFGLRCIAPVIVLNDEADLGDAQRSNGDNDGGVSARLMNMQMRFLSDPKIRGKVLFINCTNRPDRIDPALMRSGRSDERLVLPMPDLESREAIIQVMFKKYKITHDIKDFTKFAEMTDNFSGADLEKICRDAKKKAFRQELPIVNDELFQSVIENFIPSSNQKQNDEMTLVSLAASSSKELLPKNTRELVLGIIKRGLVPNLMSRIEDLVERGIVNLSDLQEEMTPIKKAPSTRKPTRSKKNPRSTKS